MKESEIKHLMKQSLVHTSNEFTEKLITQLEAQHEKEAVKPRFDLQRLLWIVLSSVTLMSGMMYFNFKVPIPFFILCFGVYLGFINQMLTLIYLNKKYVLN